MIEIERWTDILSLCISKDSDQPFLPSLPTHMANGLQPLPPCDEWLPADPLGEFDDSEAGKRNLFAAMLHALERTARWLGLPDRVMTTAKGECVQARLIDQLCELRNNGAMGLLLMAVTAFRDPEAGPSCVPREDVLAELQSKPQRTAPT